MFKGTIEAKRLFEENIYRPILYIFDPDVDGLISGREMCSYFEKRGLSYQYYINTNRQHGFTLNLKDLEGYMIISADFSIYDEILEEMKNLDIVCINIDHHEINGELRIWDKGIVINNQYYFESEDKRYLSGAGVVFEVLKVWDENFDTDENRALVGITLLSDMRPIENDEAKEYLKKTYNQDCTEGYFKYLVENTIKSDFGFGAPRMDRSFVDFSFSPRINSMLRFNESYEAVEFILGHGMSTSDKRDLQKQYTEYLLENTRLKEYDDLISASIERNEINEFYKYLVEKGYYKEKDNLESFEFEQFIAGIEPSNFIGLACSKIKESGKNTVISLLDNEMLLRGSFRGKYDGVDYLGIFREANTVAFGHRGAFGIHEIDLAEENLREIDIQIMKNEEGYESTRNIVEVSNLSLYCDKRVYPKANNNCFVRDAYRTYIRYTGSNIVTGRKGYRYIEYLIDNMRVKCFDPELDVHDCLILPMLEKGYVNLYLYSAKSVEY